MIQEKIVNLGFFLLLSSVFLLPVNGFPYCKKIFGELSVELAFYPLFIFFFLHFFSYIYYKKSIIHFPENKFLNKLFGLFFLWVIISFAFNYIQISHSVYRNRTGMEKFLLQFVLLLFLYVVSIFIYNHLKKNEISLIFKKIKRVMFFSFIIIFLWGAFEYLYKFLNFKVGIFKELECLISINCDGYWERLKFFCGEPSYYGVYLTFACPIFISYVINLKDKVKIFVLLFLLSFFSYFTYSRTVGVVVIFQIFLFFLYYWIKRNIYGNSKALVFLFFLFFSFFLWNFNFVSKFFVFNPAQPESLKSFSFTDSLHNKSYYRNSNNSRKVMQIIGYKIALDNPFVGVGLGQYAFHFPAYIVKDDSFNPEISWNLNPNIYTKWPSVHGLFSRLSAEIGFVGLIVWLLILGSIYFYLLKIFVKCEKSSVLDDCIPLIVILPNFFLLGFAADTFRFLGYAYFFVLALVFIEKSNYDEKNNH